jgi:hypothetical protein
VALSIAARSVSAAVLDAAHANRQWAILGVYEESLNLLSGEEVVSVVRPETGNLPRGVVAGLPPGLAFKRLGLAQADRVDAGSNGLEVPGKLRIDFSNAALWQPRRHLMRSCGQPEAVGWAVKRAASVLEGSGGLGALSSHFDALAEGRLVEPEQGGLLLAQAAPILQGFVRGVLAGDLADFVEGAHGLIGLGIGLTPSGDDVLTGAIGSLVLLAERRGGMEWASEGALKIAEAAAGRTTAVALTYLRCAAAGEITELHEALLRALVAGDVEASGRACLALKAFGHSSGGEIALGTLLAVRAVC